MRVFFEQNANSRPNHLARTIAISAVAMVCATAVTGICGSQAMAATSWSNQFRPQIVWHNKHLKHIGFVAGTSAIYAHSNMLPKTEHFVQPIIKASAIVGGSSMVCTPSGLGHRSTCGTTY